MAQRKNCALFEPVREHMQRLSCISLWYFSLPAQCTGLHRRWLKVHQLAVLTPLLFAALQAT